MKQRNPDATCLNCPYCFDGTVKDEFGEPLGVVECRRAQPLPGFSYDGYHAPRHPYPYTETDRWCGEHPGFWREEA